MAPQPNSPQRISASEKHDLDGVRNALATGDEVRAATRAAAIADATASLAVLDALAQIFIDGSAFDPAVELLRRICERDPGNPSRHYNVATVERMLGHLGEAVASCQSALTLNPQFVDAFHLLVDVGAPKDFTPHMAAMEKIATDGSVQPSSVVRLSYALGQARHRLGDYETAFGHFLEGGKLTRRMAPYSVDQDLATIDRIIKSHNRATLKAHPAAARSEKPFFIIGLPRSGTTLVEQILLRSGGVNSAGEIANLSLAIMERAKRDLAPPPKDRIELVKRSLDIKLDMLGRDYLRSTERMGHGAANLIDKTPFNYLYAGLISAALPHARTIMLRRDPKDSLFGIFKTFFGGLYPFAADLTDLARYIVAYNRLADHWAETLSSSRYYQLDYERFVASPETEGKQLFAFLGREWRDVYLDPDYKRTTAVTASAAQVRKPVTDQSIGAWRAYEPWLSEALAILKA